MDIYLIRHTTPQIEKGICYGQSDLNLVDSYPEEFKNIITQIPNHNQYTVFSSPLKRCALLAKQFSNTIFFDNRLKELDFGKWELKAWHDIPEKEITPWMQDFVNTSVPNGESYTQLAFRVNKAFEAITNSKKNETIIIVTHAGPIRAILSNLIEIPLKDSFNIKINYGDVFHLKNNNNSIKPVTEINL